MPLERPGERSLQAGHPWPARSHAGHRRPAYRTRTPPEPPARGIIRPRSPNVNARPARGCSNGFTQVPGMAQPLAGGGTLSAGRRPDVAVPPPQDAPAPQWPRGRSSRPRQEPLADCPVSRRPLALVSRWGSRRPDGGQPRSPLWPEFSPSRVTRSRDTAALVGRLGPTPGRLGLPSSGVHCRVGGGGRLPDVLGIRAAHRRRFPCRSRRLLGAGPRCSDGVVPCRWGGSRVLAAPLPAIAHPTIAGQHGTRGIPAMLGVPAFLR